MNCKRCRNSICSPDTRIICAVCDAVYHIASCSGIEPELIPAMIKNKDQFCWKCEICMNEKVPSNVDRSINKVVGSLIEKLEQKINGQISILDGEVKRCKKNISAVASSCEKEHQQLEKRCYELELQLHRPNLLISNLPKSMDMDPNEMVIKIVDHLGLQITRNQIAQCFYLNKNNDFRTILVKFSSVDVRDEVMAKYWNVKDLVLSNVCETDIRSRIYLNEHLPSKLSAMRGFCSKIKKRGVIFKFKVQVRSGTILVFEQNGSTPLEMSSISQLKEKFATQDES